MELLRISLLAKIWHRRAPSRWHDMVTGLGLDHFTTANQYDLRHTEPKWGAGQEQKCAVAAECRVNCINKWFRKK
jgi:hypothetical protein